MLKKTLGAIAVFCSAVAAFAAGFDGRHFTTNDWFDASFTTLAADTEIITNTATGITMGAGSWTVAPTDGTATVVADDEAGGGATVLSLDAPGEELVFTPAALVSQTGYETVSFVVKGDAIESIVDAGDDVQAAFALYDDGSSVTARGLTADGWTNLVYAAGADTLTNVWFTLYMDFANVSSKRYVRYSVMPSGAASPTVLADSEETTWFETASDATTVTSLALSGIGKCRSFSGDSLEEIPVAEVNGVSYGSLNDAIAADNVGDTVTLVRNTFDNEAIAATKSVTVALGAYNLTAESFSVSSGSTLTFTGTGSVTAPAITGGGSLVFSNAATLTLTGSSTSTIESLTADAAITLWSNGPIDISEITANEDFTFAGRIASASALTKKGTGTVTLVSVTAPAGGIVIEAGDIIIDNTLSGISPYVILDASDESTITETDGKVTAWASTVNNHSFTNEYSAMTYVAAEGVFGGKKAVRTNNSQLQSDFVSANASISVFAALHYYANSGTGGLLFYRSGANNVYIGKRNSGNNYWSALRASSTPIPLWQNSGAVNENFQTQDTVLSVEGMSNGGAANNHVGGAKGDIAIAELITLSSNPSMANRKRIEAYLGTKWVISGMTTLPASIPLTLAGGTSLDLNGLSRTFDSIALTGTGTAEVVGGALTISAPISVAVGQTLIIPYGSTYTCASGTGANIDTTAGTVTFVHNAADIDGVAYDTVQGAILAYESGTLTIHENATDIDLGTAEVNISGVVFDEGVSAPTFSTTLPWQTTYSEGSLTHARVASTFVYVGPAAYAAVASNFEIGGVAASDVPGESDSVQFDTSTTISIGSENIVYAAAILNADVTVIGAGTNYLYVDGYTGAGKLILGDGCKLCSNAQCTIATPLEIADDATAAIHVTLTFSGYDSQFMLTGAMTGSGTLNVTRSENSGYGGIEFSGDTSGFYGTINERQPKNANAKRNSLRFRNSDFSNASVNLTTGTGSTNNRLVFMFADASSVIKFGSLNGALASGSSGAFQGHATIEVGNLGNVDSVSGKWIPDDISPARSPYIRKVGTGTLTTTAANAYGYILNGGTLKVLATDTAPVTTEVKGAMIRGTTETIDAVDYKVYTLFKLGATIIVF